MGDFIKKGSPIDRWLDHTVDKIDKSLKIERKDKTREEIINTNINDRLDSIEDTLKKLVRAIIKLIEKR